MIKLGYTEVKTGKGNIHIEDLRQSYTKNFIFFRFINDYGIPVDIFVFRSNRAYFWGRLWKHRVEETIHGVLVKLAHIDDLIRFKMSSKRKKDMDDVVWLKRIKEYMKQERV